MIPVCQRLVRHLIAGVALLSGVGAVACTSAPPPQPPQPPPPPSPSVSVARATATATAPAATSPSGTVEDAAHTFATAMVAGDLAGLMRFFAPSGLQQAMAMQQAAGGASMNEVSQATIVAVAAVPSAPDQKRVRLHLRTASGQSVLMTDWAVSSDGAWRIVAITTGS